MGPFLRPGTVAQAVVAFHLKAWRVSQGKLQKIGKVQKEISSKGSAK